MKRYSAIRIFNKAMEEGDIGMFIGEAVCKEAFAYDRPGNLYLSKHENLLSVGLGMAMCSKRKIFMFCDDEYFLRNISEAAHIAVSKCENVYLVVLISGVYTDVTKAPTIYDSIMSLHGILFNMGFIVHDYKRQFRNTRNPIREINLIWNRIRGPLAVLLEVDKGTKNLPADYLSEKKSLLRTKEFIVSNEALAHNYEPPISLEEAFGREE